MLRLFVLLFVCVSCSAASDAPDSPGVRSQRPYVTQTEVPVPDYRLLLRQAPLSVKGRSYREPTSRAPRDAKAVGDVWIARLKAREALLGAGLAGKRPDAPVSLIDTGLTEAEFVAWAKANRWQIPGHIRWGFVSELKLPRVNKAAETAIRIWPASTARTGLQPQALFNGRVELRDGCFFVGVFEEPANRLAWFHTEIGLDKDRAGYLILRDRQTGQTRARIGEKMVWGGPPSAVIDAPTRRALQAACGDHEIMVVGSPESHERFLTKYPHLRNRQPPPPPPSRLKEDR